MGCNSVMNCPLFSIVVPIYNVEAYLNRCVESLVNQSYKSLDIILVDDGSPDGCPAMCDDWARRDTRIRVIHKDNQGLGMARNTGLDSAKGDYICFVDSDDYLVPDAVERCFITMEKYKADTILFGRYDAYPNGEVIEDEKHVVESVFLGDRVPEVLLPELFTSGMGYGVSACSKVFSVRILNENHIRFKSEREIISEDSFFCLDYFSKSRNAVVISDRLYCYFKNEKSLSRTYRDDRQKKNNEFLLQSIGHLHQLSLPNGLSVYLKSKYHVFSLAAMKHIMASTLSQKDKRSKLREIYKDRLLRKTIMLDVLRRDPFSIAVFMLLVKIRVYCMCDLLLKIKVKR